MKSKKNKNAQCSDDTSISFMSPACLTSNKESKPSEDSCTSSDITLSASAGAIGGAASQSERNKETTSSDEDISRPTSSKVTRGNKARTPAQSSTRATNRFANRNYRYRASVANVSSSETSDEELENIFHKCFSKETSSDRSLTREKTDLAADANVTAETSSTAIDNLPQARRSSVTPPYPRHSQNDVSTFLLLLNI